MLITTGLEGTTRMIVSQTSICRPSSYGVKIGSKLLEDKDAYFRAKDLAKNNSQGGVPVLRVKRGAHF